MWVCYVGCYVGLLCGLLCSVMGYLCLDEERERFDYYPEDQVFTDSEAIPQDLMLSVIEKYKSVKEYCKWCYYKSTKQVLT